MEEPAKRRGYTPSDETPTGASRRSRWDRFSKQEVGLIAAAMETNSDPVAQRLHGEAFEEFRLRVEAEVRAETDG